MCQHPSPIRMRSKRLTTRKRTFFIVMTVVIMHRGWLLIHYAPLTSHLSVLDHCFKGANLVCVGNFVMNAIKNLKGLRWGWGRQLVQLYWAAHTAVISGLMRAVTLGGHNTIIQWKLTFIRFFFVVFLNAVHSDIVCLWGCLAHRQRCLLFIGA